MIMEMCRLLPGSIPFWRKDEQGVYQKVEGSVYATDAEGRFYLHDGEKAVFSEIPDVSVLEVKEDENPFWEVDMEEKQEGSNRTLTFKNAYRRCSIFIKMPCTGRRIRRMPLYSR